MSASNPTHRKGRDEWATQILMSGPPAWTSIDQAVAALLPFADFNAAKSAGFDTSQSFNFNPFTPTLPSPLGAFNSFGGC